MLEGRGYTKQSDLKYTRTEEKLRDNRRQGTCTEPAKTSSSIIKRRKGAGVWEGQYKRKLEVFSGLIHSVL